MNSAFSFQVMSNGITINLKSEVKFNNIVSELKKHVQEAQDFFAGGDLYVNINNHSLESSQLQELINILKNYRDVQNIYFTSENKSISRKDTEQEAASKNNETRDRIKKNNNKNTVLVKRTLRSGQKIKYASNIVIIGDINPGAEVIAAGDIIVIGRLKGVVHAGANGSREAQVLALKLEPTQLRIANIISRPPESTENIEKIQPERAYIQDRSIIVEKLKH